MVTVFLQQINVFCFIEQKQMLSVLNTSQWEIFILVSCSPLTLIFHFFYSVIFILKHTAYLENQNHHESKTNIFLLTIIGSLYSCGHRHLMCDAVNFTASSCDGTVYRLKLGLYALWGVTVYNYSFCPLLSHQCYCKSWAASSCQVTEWEGFIHKSLSSPPHSVQAQFPNMLRWKHFVSFLDNNRPWHVIFIQVFRHFATTTSEI